MLFHDFSLLDMFLSPTRDDSGKTPVCAIHTRIGRDHIDPALDTDTNGGARNFFHPRIGSGDESLTCCRNWSVVARTVNFEERHDSVYLFVIPLGRKAAGEDDPDDRHTYQVPFYLGARLVLPSSFRVKEIEFYGDDGNSSLSDRDTGQEGRQSLGLLVSCPVKEQDITLISEELWLIGYDNIVFEHVRLPPVVADQSPNVLDESLIGDESTIHVQPLGDSQNEVANDEAVIYAKSTFH